MSLIAYAQNLKQLPQSQRLPVLRSALGAEGFEARVIDETCRYFSYCEIHFGGSETYLAYWVGAARRDAFAGC